MLTREEFVQKAIEISTAKYPAVAALVKASDPRILQQIEAMATMLAMYSSQLEVAQSEPFEKTRDSTVLADAAMRGIVPKSTPAYVNILATNSSTSTISIEQGRSIMDVSGRLHRSEISVDIGAGEAALITASQLYSKEEVHTVSNGRPFYEIQVATADDDSYLCGLSVIDSSGSYEYRERYVNTLDGERVYHIETDERRRVYVRFGQDGVVGTQPVDGTEITITSYYSMGDIEYKSGSPMVFESMLDPSEAYLDMKLSEVMSSGQNPPTIQTLRELAKYPSIYNHNAVFLGEFDFLVRRNFPSLQFLSVWNEAIEESIRGVSFDNINALFVAVLSDDGSESVLTQASGEIVAPQKITALTQSQLQIKAKILAADDSYRIVFYTPVRSEINVQIQAVIASSYDETTVNAQITKVILDNFGASAQQSKRGHASPLYQQIYQLLKANVPALSVGRADLKVYIDETDSTLKPELWRYISAASLTVSVMAGNVVTPYWGSGF